MSRTDSPLLGRVAFLVGVRRSGTNWLRRTVDAHPDASVIPSETYLVSHGVAPMAERVQHGIVGSTRTGTMFADRDRFLDAARAFCDDLLLGHLETLDESPRLVAERTPDHVRHLGLIADVFPDAPVVHIVRDGRDVARSLVSQSWGPTTYTAAAEEWVSGIEAARRDADRPHSYLEVRYEDLLADPPTEVARLFGFLGLAADDDTVAAALREAEVTYNADPADSAVRAAKWAGHLDEAELAEVTAVAGPLLDDLGYPPAGAVARPAPPLPSERPVVARAVGRAKALASPGARLDGAPLASAVMTKTTERLPRLEAVLDDVAAGRFDSLARHLGPKARIRVLDGAGSWEARGEGAVARLAEAWRHDPALAGHQIRGDVHPGVPSFTFVGTWRTGDDTHDRVLVASWFGDRIDELTWYVLPRVPT